MAAVLSEADQKYLNADQQAQIKALKEQYAAATDQAGRDAAHAEAEKIRQQAANGAYSGGNDGSGYVSAFQQTASNPATGQVNGKTAEQMRQDLEDYRYYHQRGTNYQNGYGADANVRSQANMIRQQMEKNSADWFNADAATKDYLHQQNVELEKLLQEYAGGATSTYDPATGNWYTNNGNVGYGIANIGPYDEWAKYGISEDYYNYLRNTTDRYHNMVDYGSITNPVQNADGFSGVYSPYEYGAIQNYIGIGASTPRSDFYHYDAIGDNFMEESSMRPDYDKNGNIVYKDDYIKPGVHASAYTQQFMPEIVDGIIQTNDYIMSRPGGGRGEVNTDPNASATGGGGGGGGGYGSRYPSASSGASGSMGGGSGNGDYSSMLEQMYGEALAAQLAQLEQSYNQNLSDLKSSSTKVDNTYNEQKRQADGQSAQNAAAWREMANAYGLNSGAIGQAALAQNNQRQSDLNTLASAQAQAQAEIEQQRVLLGQQYQLQINQAIAENNMQKAEALYQEAVRMDEKLQQQQQYNSNLMLQYAQMAMQQQQYNSDLALQYAKMAGNGGGTTSQQYIAPTTDNANNVLPSTYYDSLMRAFETYPKAGLYDELQVLAVDYAEKASEEQRKKILEMLKKVNGEQGDY